MKTIGSVLLVGLCLMGCKKTPTEAAPPAAQAAPTAARGQALFEGEGQCTTCHQLDRKVIGPSLKEIAQVYRHQKGDLLGFLQGKKPALVDPTQYAAMQVNLEKLKTWPQADLEALVAYLRSFE